MRGRIVWFVMPLLAVGIFLGAWTALAQTVLADVRTSRLVTNEAINYSDVFSPTLHLPLIFGKYPKSTTMFGVEISRGYVDQTVNQATSAKVSWVRYNGIKWHEIEPQQGVYNWAALDGVSQELIQLRAQGLEPEVVIRGTPDWAQLYPPGNYCGPIKPDALDDFANFVFQVVSRYSAWPYSIKYWEMGNEPDVDKFLITPTFPYGCWGEESDEYYGGRYYAEMLKAVYPAVKQANLNAKVILGGLLLVCDPTNPPPGDDCKPGKFLEGVFLNGGAAYIDIIAYHAYPYWYSDLPNTEEDLLHPFWSHRGGILLGKLDYLKNLMAQYQVDKPILMNEGGLVCGWTEDQPEYARCLTDALAEDQANYVPRLYVRSWANGIDGVMWYTLNGPGWREGGLLNEDQVPKAGFFSYNFLAAILDGAMVQEQLSEGILEGYAFINPLTHRTYQIYWANDGTLFSIPKPANMLAVYNQYGANITPVGDTIPVGFNPITIIEISGP